MEDQRPEWVSHEVPMEQMRVKFQEAVAHRWPILVPRQMGNPRRMVFELLSFIRAEAPSDGDVAWFTMDYSMLWTGTETCWKRPSDAAGGISA